MGNEIMKAPATELSIEALEKMADYVVKSKLFGNINTRENAMTLFLLCQAEGLHPMEACKQYDIIQGKPALKADTMLARFISRGGKWKWIMEECTDKQAAALVNDQKITFTFEEAASLGLTGKDNYKKQPATMLRKRLIGKAIRMVDPGAVLGLYNESEIIDITETTRGTDNPPRNGRAQDLPRTVETTATHEPEPAPEQKKPEPKTTKNFSFLKEMEKMKKELGEQMYYRVLGNCSFEHANQIDDRKTQIAVYTQMKEALKDKQDAALGSAPAGEAQ